MYDMNTEIVNKSNYDWKYVYRKYFLVRTDFFFGFYFFFAFLFFQ